MRHIKSSIRWVRPITITAAAAFLALSSGPAWAGSGVTHSPTTAFGRRMASLNPGTGIFPTAVDVNAIAMCTKVAAKAGFSFSRTVNTPLGPEPRVAVAVAIAMAESGCTLDAVNKDSNGSKDRGLWQINNQAWPSVPDACAFQIQCNADAAYTISSDGSDWSPWATYSNGAWQRYIGFAVTSMESGFTFLIGNEGTGGCLAADAASQANGAPIALGTCDSADNHQQWRVLATPGTMVILQNVADGTCLDADGTARGQGNPIFQWACDATNPSEQWSFNGSGALNANGNADAGLQNNEDGTCASADPSNPGKVLQWTCTTSSADQQWN